MNQPAFSKGDSKCFTRSAVDKERNTRPAGGRGAEKESEEDEKNKIGAKTGEKAETEQLRSVSAFIK